MADERSETTVHHIRYQHLILKMRPRAFRSEASVKSGWVQYEIGEAIRQGLIGDNYKLCPVMLDKYWLEAPQLNGMVLDQLKQFLVMDFADWRTDSDFKDKFGRLLKGLGIHYREV